jgi:hypothetical protein
MLRNIHILKATRGPRTAYENAAQNTSQASVALESLETIPIFLRSWWLKSDREHLGQQQILDYSTRLWGLRSTIAKDQLRDIRK